MDVINCSVAVAA